MVTLFLNGQQQQQITHGYLISKWSTTKQQITHGYLISKWSTTTTTNNNNTPNITWLPYF